MESKNSGNKAYLPLIIAIAVVAGILIGRFYAGLQAENRFIIVPKANKLENVLNYIEDEYVDDISKDQIVENTIPKILEDLDPHSQYIPAKDVQELTEPLRVQVAGDGAAHESLLELAALGAGVEFLRGLLEAEHDGWCD